ncbi:MAG: tyrosine-protein phosphatase [Caulobacteraceae bacterium]
MISKPAVFALPLALLLGAQGAALAKVAGEKAERTAPDKVVVTWTDANPVDVYQADRPDGGLAGARLVSGRNGAGRFEAPATPTARPYFLLKDTRDGAVVRVAERVVPLQQGSNFRDLGGYAAAGGKHVRWGRIYRSGGTPLLTDTDVATVQALGLTDLVDLRSSEERTLAPTRIYGVHYSAVGYSLTTLLDTSKPVTGDERMHSTYGQMPTLLAPQLRILFRTLRAHEGPVAYNCSAGQDRTGLATALVLTALGVPRDVIFADYHLSTTYRRPDYEMPRIDAATQASNPVAAFFAGYQNDPRARTPQPLFDAEHRPLLQFALAEIERRWGSIDAYLDKELGVNSADIARLRADYLE